MTQLQAEVSRLDRLKRDYFGSAGLAALTVLSFGIIAGLLWAVLDWAVLRGHFGADVPAETCIAEGGACWSVIAVRWRVILFGVYPYDEQWRSAVACGIVMVMVILSCLPVMWRAVQLGLVWVLGTISFYVLMRGGVFGLVAVDEQQWGGLPLTLFLFVATSVVGMPLAVGLALMRRSELPVISRVTGWLIDTVRSLPLLSILFAFALFMPLVLPDYLSGSKLYRVILGSAFFFAAYQAEIIRGGFQGIPKGQEEAAKALGLSYWHRISRIVLPQAFRLALPATINQFVITFMETSLVVVVGFIELIAAAKTAYTTGVWKFAYVEVYAFVAIIYFSFVFGLSRYGAFLEARLNAGQRKE